MRTPKTSRYRYQYPNFYQQLVWATGVRCRKKESLRSYARRVLREINRWPDAGWVATAEHIQLWSNDTMRALEEKSRVPRLEGFPNHQKKKKQRRKG